jgi:tRNA G10  N-methylase Trm11
MPVVRSISNSEDEILLGILALHNLGLPFDADVCYSRGSFYKTGLVPQPRLKFDLDPLEGVTFANVVDLPLKSGSLDSLVFDPPFMFNPHGGAGPKGKVARSRLNRFTAFPTWLDLEQTYKVGLREFHRVLRPGGILAFKCQDYTDSKTTLTHCHVWQWATERGFYAKDLFIRYRDHGPAYNPGLQQRHARKYHSYWFVFERK